jgi:ATP:ADP antiporter, AAA family
MIKNFLVKTFNLRPEETSKFSLLFFHSFFLGLLISFHFVPANSIFIKHFGGDSLPLAYLAAGILGYLTTILYSQLQKKVNSGMLFKGALLFLFFVTILQRVGLYFIDEKWMSFFVFIWAPPIFSLISMETGGLALRLLDLRQMKRLFGMISIGSVVASLLSYLLIPTIIRFLSHPYDLLYFGALGVVVSMVLLVYILKKFKEDHTQQQENVSGKPEMDFRDLIKERYFLLIFLAAALSSLVVLFCDFGYLASIKAQSNFLHNPQEVSKFISLVCATFKAGELIFSYFSNRILSRHGMKLGLTILPTVSSGLIFIAAVLGLTLGDSSILFFAFMVANKIIDRTLRMSLGELSFNILYQPLPNKQKLAIQTRVGVVIQVASGVAGLLLLVLGNLLHSDNGFMLKYYTLFFLPILIAWFIVSRKLFLAYREKLRQILVDISKDTKREMHKTHYGTELLTKKFKKFNQSVVNLSVTILSETNPIALDPHASGLLEIEDKMLRKAILLKLDPTWRPKVKDSVKKLCSPTCPTEMKDIAQNALKYFEAPTAKYTEADIEKLVASGTYADKIEVVKFLNKNKHLQEEAYILQLIADENKTIKRAGIKLSSKVKSPVVISTLIGLLKSSEYYHLSSNALLEIGEKIISELEKFLKNNRSSELMLRVIEIYAKIGSNSAKTLLVSHLNYPDREVQLAVAMALYFCKYQATAKDQPIIKQKIEETVENILWIYASIIDIEEEKNTLKLFQALDEEREANFELLFKLLSFMYEPRIINLIRKNIIGKNTIFALEIIDNFFNQDLKQLIIPLFDDISIKERLRRFHYLFPQHKMSFADRLKDIIVRDYNKVDNWSRSKAIELLGKIHKQTYIKPTIQNIAVDNSDLKLWTRERIGDLLAQIRKSEMPDEIFACLFHSDELVYSTAAKIIYEENPIRCNDYLVKLSKEKQKLSQLLAGEETEAKFLLSDRVRLLKRHPLFFSVPENVLLKMAKLFTVKDVSKGETVFIEYNKDSDDIFILAKGQMVFAKGTENEIIYEKDDIIIKGLNLPIEAEYIEGEKLSQLLIANRIDYFNLLTDKTDLIEHVFNGLQVPEKEEESE